MQNESLFTLAKQYIPGGVNSPVRAFDGVGGDPLFIQSANGAYITDAAGKRYIDYVGSWGPMILGHAHPTVLQAVIEKMQHGLSFGAPTEIEIKLAKKITELMPSIEQVRMVSSGTEAAMSAIRLARGFTKKNKIIKFAGCYHGHADSLLVKAGSGALTLGVPNSAGVPESIVQHTLVAEFNRIETVLALFKKYPEDIAAVIIEPIAGNMNCVPATLEFLKKLRALCDIHESLLIFDEVITGFRVALGGAQSYFSITPDITVLGKIIGGGMPVGAFGGRKDIMQAIAPLGPVYQAGTLSGNPIAMAAGLATLEQLTAPHFHLQLSLVTQQLMQQIKALSDAARIPLQIHAVGGMFGLFFASHPIETLADVNRCDVARFKKFFHGMLKEGIYLAPSAFECGFMSAAHGQDEIEKTLQAVEKVFQQLK